MPNDTRSVDRQDLDSMTREFLARGGKINQCPPGSSDNVVYKKGNFRRRPQAGTASANPAQGPAQGQQQDAGAAGEGVTPAESAPASPAAPAPAPAPIVGDSAAD